MWRSVVAITFLLFLSACASSANAPTVQPFPTSTVLSKDQALSSCETLEDVPNAVLSYGDQRQDDARMAINWQFDDCAITGHPFVTLPLPPSVIRIPRGERPVLEFSAQPESVSGYAWEPAFDKVEESSSNRLEVPLDDLRRSTLIDLEFEPSISQVLDLSALPPAEYAIEVFTGWRRGSSGFAFRVEIIEP